MIETTGNVNDHTSHRCKIHISECLSSNVIRSHLLFRLPFIPRIRMFFSFLLSSRPISSSINTYIGSITDVIEIPSSKVVQYVENGVRTFFTLRARIETFFRFYFFVVISRTTWVFFLAWTRHSYWWLWINPFL